MESLPFLFPMEEKPLCSPSLLPALLFSSLTSPCPRPLCAQWLLHEPQVMCLITGRRAEGECTTGLAGGGGGRAVGWCLGLALGSASSGPW